MVELCASILEEKGRQTQKLHNSESILFLFHRLCGRVPFQSDSPGKLEELIMQGELKFGEIEWINVSQAGMYT